VPLVALLIFAGELGLPTGIPIEVALLLAGAYAVHSVQGLIAGVLLVAVADLLGTTALHMAVRTGGVRLLDRVLRKHKERQEQTMQKWRSRLGGRDSLVVFVIRLLPIVRMYVSIGTGLLRIRIRSFIAGAAPAGMIWAGTPLVIGYIFRTDAHRLEAHYATATHVMLAILPLFGLVLGAVLWARHAHPTRTMVLRGRSILGFVAAAAVSVYIGTLVWGNQWSIERGSVGLPRPVLELWMAALVVLAVLLLGFAALDLRIASGLRQRQLRLAAPQRMMAGMAGMVVWLSLLTAAGGIPILLELRYPGL
jgi:membrane protein DedA with SNARE-associated domain